MSVKQIHLYLVNCYIGKVIQVTGKSQDLIVFHVQGIIIVAFLFLLLMQQFKLTYQIMLFYCIQFPEL